MSSLARSRSVAVVVFASLMAFALALPALASAATGDQDNPVQLGALPWSLDATGSLLPASDDMIKGWYFYRFAVAKGKTVQFTVTTPSGKTAMLMQSGSGTPLIVGSDVTAPGAQTLTFMAPQTENYYLTLYNMSGVEAFSLSGTIIPTVPFKLKSLSVPRSKKKGKKFTVSVKVVGSYNSLYSPVKFQIQRKTGGKWKTVTTSKSVFADDDGTFTKFAAGFKANKTGTYRVRARFSDIAHATFCTAWKTMKIKR